MNNPTDHCIICGVKLGTKHKTYCVEAAERAAGKSSGGGHGVVKDRDLARATVGRLQDFIRGLMGWKKEDDHTPHPGSCDRCKFQALTDIGGE